MRRLVTICAMAVVALTLGSCSALWSSTSYGQNDLYRTDNRVAVANRLKAEAEAERAEAEARQAQWEAMLAQQQAERAEDNYYAESYYDNEPNYSNIVADDYQSAYARRLYGFQSPTYRMPSSYYSLLTNSAIFYASAYDPAFYNVMVSGDQVWVEPRYITSMFGSWGAVNITFGLYSSPWNYGWSVRTNPFYYSWWGYPRYSWYDWNWNICYHNHYYYDWWWGGYYPHHHHHHHHHHHGYYPPQRPPQHRPDHTRPGYNGHNHTTGSGASAGRPNSNLNGNRITTGNRYQSPTSNRVESAATRPTNNRGTISTGIYNGTNNRVVNEGVSTGKGSSSNTSEGSNGRYTRSDITINNGVATGSSSHSSSGNFRQSSSSSSSSSRGVSTIGGSSSSNRGQSVSGGGTTSSKRGSSSVGSSSSSSSQKTPTRINSSSSSNRSSSSSNFRQSSSSSRSSSSSSSSYNRSSSSSSSSRSSGGYSSGSSSSGSSRSGGGTTSSRR